MHEIIQNKLSIISLEIMGNDNGVLVFEGRIPVVVELGFQNPVHKFFQGVGAFKHKSALFCLTVVARYIEGITMLTHTFRYAEIRDMDAVFLGTLKIKVDVGFQIFFLGVGFTCT